MMVKVMYERYWALLLVNETDYDFLIMRVMRDSWGPQSPKEVSLYGSKKAKEELQKRILFEAMRQAADR